MGTLRKNYSRYREELEAELRAESARGREDLKDPILEKAFEEPVEVWKF